jgi:hypothetical protein
MNNPQSEVHDTMAAINRSWRENRPSEVDSCLHPEVTMVLPGFSGVIRGKDALTTSLIEFCSNARVLEYTESDEQIQVIEDTAFVNYRFDMVYERAAYRERSIGRDVWAFARCNGKWLAIWRLMTDLKEEREKIK